MEEHAFQTPASLPLELPKHRGGTSKALQALGISALQSERQVAERTLERAHACPRCASLLEHLFDCLGSTFYFDDDPALLARSFDDAVRDPFTVRVLAACIVLRGRERTSATF